MCSTLKNLILIFCCSIFFSCSTNDNSISDSVIADSIPPEEPTPEDPVPVVYFTAEIGCEAPGGNMGSWMILHRENGELLDFKSYESGDIVIFEALESEHPEVFTMTNIAINNTLGTTWNRIESTTEITKGTVLDLTCAANEEETSNAAVGSFNLTVTNVPTGSPLANFVASNGQYRSSGSSSSANPGFRNYTAELEIFDKKTDYLITINDGLGDSNHTVINDYNDGDAITIDYDQFMPFDSYFNIEIPTHLQFSLYSTAIDNENNSEYFINLTFSSGGFEQVLKRGFLNRFETYNSIFSIKLNDVYEYKYLKAFAEPEVITIPEQPSFNIENESLTTFRFTTSVSNYSKKKSYWSYREGPTGNDYFTSWRIDSSGDYLPTIGNLPPELTEQYPELNIQELKYQRTKLFLNEEEEITISKL